MRLSLLACLVFVAGLSCSEEEGAVRPPNVVVIFTDDQRWDGLGVEGHPFLKTPNLDRLAAEGARFTDMAVTTSLCSPSRASFLSGLYAHTHKVLDNFTDYPKDLDSYPRRMQANGYETAYIGKWHMGQDSDEKRPGFDYWVTHKGQGSTTTPSSTSTASGKSSRATTRRCGATWRWSGSSRTTRNRFC